MATWVAGSLEPDGYPREIVTETWVRIQSNDASYTRQNERLLRMNKSEYGRIHSNLEHLLLRHFHSHEMPLDFFCFLTVAV